MSKQLSSCVGKYILLSVSAIVTLTLSSCATLSKQECKLGDWQSIGYNDGVNGHLPSHIGKHQKACARASVLPDYARWESGRQKGLKRYCTEDNAYRLGKLGYSINNVCPFEMIDKLEKINTKGIKVYNLKKQIDNNQEKLNKYNEELTKLKNGEMLGFKTESEARTRMVELLNKIRHLEEQTETTQRLLDSRTYR